MAAFLCSWSQSLISLVYNFRATGDVKRTWTGHIDLVRQSVLRSPRYSARKHATAADFPDHSVRQILHEELNLHPCKPTLVLNSRDIVAREDACEALLAIPDDVIIFFGVEAHLLSKAELALLESS